MRVENRSQSARRQVALKKKADTAGAAFGDEISLLKLFEHVSRNRGPQLAGHLIREKWLSGEIRFRVHWVGENVHARMFYSSASPGVALPHDEEPAPPSFLAGVEGRGLTFYDVIRLSEHGIYMDDRKTAYLFASRADAARFWPWSGDQPRAKRGRRSSLGAKFGWDWEAALIEAAAFMLENGVPETQAELVKHVSIWFDDDGPGDTQIKAHVAPLYRRAKSAAGR